MPQDASNSGAAINGRRNFHRPEPESVFDMRKIGTRLFFDFVRLGYYHALSGARFRWTRNLKSKRREISMKFKVPGAISEGWELLREPPS